MPNHIWPLICSVIYAHSYMDTHIFTIIYLRVYCIQTQDAHNEMCKLVRETYSTNFWNVFSSVYEEKNVLIDRVLATCKKLYCKKNEKKRFETSVRQLISKSKQVAGHFPLLVLHDKIIKVAQFGLPGNLKEVKFTFINPLWAWVSASNDMKDAGFDMHFEPKAMWHERTGHRLYGAGVQFGDALKFAAARTPVNGKPALFGISFDGGDSGVSNRSVYPVCVSSLNFNGTDPMQCGLVGFLPVLDVPKSFKSTEKFQKAKDHVLQECIGAILDEIENVATDGFTARLGQDLVTLYPFLVAVRVDSKERKSYFGLKSDRYVLHHI